VYLHLQSVITKMHGGRNVALLALAPWTKAATNRIVDFPPLDRMFLI
jgi:hypothetical protein